LSLTLCLLHKKNIVSVVHVDGSAELIKFL